MVTNYKSIYEPRTQTAGYDMSLYSISDITINPKEKYSIPLGISIQMNDNREAEQAPYIITPELSLLYKGLSYDQNPIYIYNRANYYQPFIGVFNNTDTVVKIPKYSPVGLLTNNTIFDLIII
jgi:hypothetical protein